MSVMSGVFLDHVVVDPAQRHVPTFVLRRRDVVEVFARDGCSRAIDAGEVCSQIFIRARGIERFERAFRILVRRVPLAGWLPVEVVEPGFDKTVVPTTVWMRRYIGGSSRRGGVGLRTTG